MKKNLLFVAFSIITGMFIVGLSMHSATSYPEGAPSSVAGAPGDNGKTCAKNGCHPGNATAIFDAITSDVPVTGYEPGTTYTITASITDPSLVKFGFEISPQSASGTLLGTMSILDAVTTKFTSSSNKYITHTSNGNYFPNHTATWSFNWTAPVAGTGDVTFYGAFDFANNNGGTSGDIIYTSTLVIPEAFGTGIHAIAGTQTFNVFPNPAADNATISYTLSQAQPIFISLFDLSGKGVMEMTREEQAAGTHQFQLPLSAIPSGMYVIKLTAGGQSFTRKLVKL